MQQEQSSRNRASETEQQEQSSGEKSREIAADKEIVKRK